MIYDRLRQAGLMKYNMRRALYKEVEGRADRPPFVYSTTPAPSASDPYLAPTALNPQAASYGRVASGRHPLSRHRTRPETDGDIARDCEASSPVSALARRG